MVIKPTKYKEQGSQIEFVVINVIESDKSVKKGALFSVMTDFFKKVLLKSNYLKKVSCNKGCATIARNK